jgi:hypothetical protein
MNPHLREVLHTLWQARKVTRSFDKTTAIGHAIVLEMWKMAAKAVEKHIGTTLSSEMKPVYWFNSNPGAEAYPEALLRVVQDFEATSLNDAIKAWDEAKRSQQQVDLAHKMKLPISLSPEQYFKHTHLIDEANYKVGRHLHAPNFSANLDEIERILILENLKREQGS